MTLDVVVQVAFWLAAAVFAVSACISVWVIFRIVMPLLQVRAQAGLHDDSGAVGQFLALLSAAKESMIVYDAGNGREGAVYQDTRVIDAVRKKLDECPGFEMRCLFNCDDDLPFKQAFEHEARIVIRTRDRMRGAQDTHYQIIDGGKQAYLSRRVFGASIRKYKMIDFSDVPERRVARAARFVLGEYQKDFERCFGSAEAT